VRPEEQVVLWVLARERFDVELRQRSVYTYVRDVGLCSGYSVSHCPFYQATSPLTDFATGAIVYVWV